MRRAIEVIHETIKENFERHWSACFRSHPLLLFYKQVVDEAVQIVGIGVICVSCAFRELREWSV